MLEAVADHFGFSLDTPFRDLKEEHRRAVLYGTDEKIQFVFQRKNRTYRVNRRFEA